MDEKKFEAVMRFAVGQMLLRPDGGVLAYELMERCKNPQHRFSGSSAEQLENLGLLEQGQLHDEVKSAVLRLLKGEGFSWEIDLKG